jgi:hypothetical protein
MFKQLCTLIGLLSVTCTVIADHCPLSLTGPTTTTLNCSPSDTELNSTVLTFTVTNHTHAPIGFHPTIGGAAPTPSSIVVTGGSCPKNVVRARNSCTVEVTVTAGLCSAITPPSQMIDAVLDVKPDINQGLLKQPFEVTVNGAIFRQISCAAQKDGEIMCRFHKNDI